MSPETRPHGEPGRSQQNGAASIAAQSPLADRLLAAACFAVILFGLLQILTFGYGRDQGIYAMVARSILEGGMPYRDAWDFKPPGIFLIYALARALFGDAQYGIRVLEVLGLAATSLGIVSLAERWWGSRLLGLGAAAIAVLVHAQLDFWHTAQPESFGGMLTIAALLLVERGQTRETATSPGRAALLWTAAGVLFGAAGLLKPPLAGGGATAALVLGLRAWRRAPPAERPLRALVPALRPALFIALGGALPIAVCLAWFAAKGALGDLHKVLFVFTPYYTAIGWEGSSPLGMMYYGFAEWLTNYSSLTTVGLLLLVAYRVEPAERPGVAMLGGVIAIHIIGVVMQGKFFPYHYGATWPLTAMLAGLGLWKAWDRSGRRSLWKAALFGVGIVVVAFGRSATKDVPGSFFLRSAQRIALLASTDKGPEARDRLASVADVNAVANRAVAELLRARTPADRPVFVWGFEPVIYDLADRPTASRYLYNVPQRVAWAKAPAREELMRDLAARPPAAIVVERHDVFPMVTGDAIDSADTLHDFPALRDLLATRYALEATIEDFDIYFERP